MTTMWRRLDLGARLALVTATAVILAGAAWALYLTFKDDYGVLFSDLTQSDAAAIVARLKENKTKYKLSENGAVVSVPAEQVHDVRLELMTSDLPLSGGVGFEIFDRQGLGATEHSQRVSFQRALQGELSRTIGTLEGVKQARVHLVLPESSLFRKDQQQTTASVTLAMKPGASVDRQQILGVQRLVAASVPGLTSDHVIVTNHRGVTLSNADESQVGAGAMESRLQVKRDIEEYVTRKIARLLDSAYGPGQAIVSVDATLSFDATKRTIQDLLPGRNAAGESEGRVVKRRQVLNPTTADPSWTNTAETGERLGAARTAGSSLEVEYEYGRRLEEVITAPGALTRLSIGVIVPEAIDENGKQKIKEIVRASAGIDDLRGDAISVQSLDDLNVRAQTSEPVEPARMDEALQPESAMPSAEDPRRLQKISVLAPWAWIAFAGIALGILVWFLIPKRLSAAEREALLKDLRGAMSEELQSARPSVRS